MNSRHGPYFNNNINNNKNDNNNNNNNSSHNIIMYSESIINDVDRTYYIRNSK